MEVVSRLLSPTAIATEDDVQRVHRMAQALVSKLDEMDMLKKILGIQEDILGAYFFGIREVRIYWMAIGIVASALGLSPSSLTTVVLSHELAHAYTHLGRDIDKERWDTTSFSGADIRIVEGLAQFYTGVLCKKLEQRVPGALHAYNELLKHQSGVYKCHL
jgi:hypothetical protein